MAHEHDRFLYEKDGKLHYGCINPFCGHGDPALPNHWAVPMETDVVKLRLVSAPKGRRYSIKAAYTKYIGKPGR